MSLSNRKINSTILTAAGICVLYLGTLFLGTRVDAEKEFENSEPNLLYIPSKELAKTFSLGIEAALASSYWVRAVLYHGDQYLQQREAKLLSDLLQVIIHLNPEFKPAYKFGSLMLSKNAESLAQEILTMGVDQFPQDWELRLYAAMSHIRLDSNFDKAAEILRPVAELNNAPDYVKLLPATFQAKSGKRKGALTYLLQEYLRTDSPMTRELYLSKVFGLYGLDMSALPEFRERVLAPLEDLSRNPDRFPYFLEGISLMLENKAQEARPSAPASKTF